MMTRPEFQPEALLGARDLAAEQKYRFERMRRHDRWLHEWGVVCGLLVVPANDPARPCAVRICPGYAVTPCGDELYVATSVLFNVQEHLWGRPPGAKIAYIAIRYALESFKPVTAIPRDCGCREPDIRMSRARDGWRIDVLWTFPENESRRHDLCNDESPVCPPPPQSPYVVLARIDL